MKYFQNIVLLAILLFFSIERISAQDYSLEIEKHREKYKSEFLEDTRSPITANDFDDMNFYKPNIQYQVMAVFTRIVDSSGFNMKTHTKVQKKYVVYGKIDFTLKNKTRTLYIYQSPDLMKKEGLEDYLFIPFKDLTNGKTTYAGGRYLDIRIGDIKDNNVTIDFNKAYNPYCAYKGGYSCPIPPQENNLRIKIEAGEKRYNKEPEE